MKCKLLLIMLAAILWATVVSDAVPALLKHRLFTRERVHTPKAEYYTLNYMPTPSWWPH